MAVCFDFSLRITVILTLLTRFYFSNVGMLASSILNNVSSRHSCRYFVDYSTDTKFAKFAVEVSGSLWAVPSVLLWCRPPGCMPYRPSSQLSVNALLTALLSLSGDNELNPRPATVHSMKFASINTQSSVLKTAIVHNVIDELRNGLLNSTNRNLD